MDEVQVPSAFELDGRQLKILLTIGEVGSLSAAAQLLDINQSTVSYWLGLLRKRLDDPLFVRVGNRLEPTERAEQLFPKARVLLRQLEEIGSAKDYDPAEDTDVLRVACGAVERESLIAPFLRSFLEVAAQMTLHLEATGSPMQARERLLQGDVEMVVLPDECLEGEMLRQKVAVGFDDVVYFDKRFPLEEGDLDAYSARPHARVILGPQPGYGVERKLARRKKSRRVALEASDFDTVLNLIVGTPMIATLPRQLAGSCRPELTYVRPPWPAASKNLVVYWHMRHQHSARHKFWRDLLTSHVST